MKNNRITFIIIAILAVIVASCGHNDSFRINGTVVDGSSINLRFVYYTDGAIRTGLTASSQGSFTFEGVSAELAPVEVYDNEYRLLGRFMAKNGEDIDLTIDRSNIYIGKATGNPMNEELTSFYNTNAEILAGRDTDARNRLVARYIAANPESPVAQLLLSTEIDASTEAGALLCDSLVGLIDPSTRVLDLTTSFIELNQRVADENSRSPIIAITYKNSDNGTETFVPTRQRLSAIAVGDGANGHDSVVNALHALAEYEKESDFAILDINVDADMSTWKRTIRRDSATWKQGWGAGAISGQTLDRLGVPSVPYFILADSAGNQLWRGRSAAQFIEETKQRLR